MTIESTGLSRSSAGIASKKTMTARLTTLSLLTLLTANAQGRVALDISARPHVSTAPSTVRVRVTVEPDAENRGISISADSPDFYRSSWVALDGDHAPRTTFVEFRNLPAGSYRMLAELRDGRGKVRAAVMQDVIVLGHGSDEPWAAP